MDPAWEELASWRGRRLGPVDVLDEVDSTNEEALRRIDAGLARSGLVLAASRQTAGRGTRGRAWIEAPGSSLALTVALAWPARAPLALAPWLGAVSVADVLGELSLEARLKWPNDALVRGRKIAGVLAETRGAGGAAGFVALGIGLNVAQHADDFPPGLTTPPTSLHLEGRQRSVPEAARRLLDALDRRTIEVEAGGEPVRAAFLELLGLHGRRVAATLPDRTVEGVLLDLELDGTLRVGGERLPGGHVAALRAL